MEQLKTKELDDIITSGAECPLDPALEIDTSCTESFAELRNDLIARIARRMIDDGKVAETVLRPGDVLLPEGRIVIGRIQERQEGDDVASS